MSGAGRAAEPPACNWGARVHAITVAVVRAVVLESELLRVTVLAGLSSDVIEFRSRNPGRAHLPAAPVTVESGIALVVMLAIVNGERWIKRNGTGDRMRARGSLAHRDRFSGRQCYWRSVNVPAPPLPTTSVPVGDLAI